MPGPQAPPWAARPAAASAATGRGIAYQFSGDALWSILFGLASIVVPLFTPFYLPVLPLFGLWRGVRAVQRGRITGGVIGLVVCVVGGLVSLLSSGLLNSLFH